MPISDEVKQAIRERARYVCEYCHSPERLSANRFTVDHVIPKTLGGSDDIDNLALACRRCNERRGEFKVKLCCCQAANPALVRTRRRLSVRIQGDLPPQTNDIFDSLDSDSYPPICSIAPSINLTPCSTVSIRVRWLRSSAAPAKSLAYHAMCLRAC